MYLYSCTTAFGAIVGICLLIYPLLKLYKKSKIQRAQLEHENEELNDNNNRDVKLQDIRKASSASVLSKKMPLKEIKKSASKFESRYLDLDSAVNSNMSLTPAVDNETKDKNNEEAENEVKHVQEI